MLKFILLFTIYFVFIHAETIDKKKILEIIKAAKQHKSIPLLKKDKTTDKKRATTLPIVVYKKRTQPIIYQKRKVNLTKLDYGFLPNLESSSIKLRKKFKIEQKLKSTTVDFKTPLEQLNSSNGINTVAKKIVY